MRSPLRFKIIFATAATLSSVLWLNSPTAMSQPVAAPAVPVGQAVEPVAETPVVPAKPPETPIAIKPAAKPAPTLPITVLLPAETQGCLQVTDLPKFIESLKKTQLGILAEDERLKIFWQDQQAEIQSRLADAGWQLHISTEELLEISTGQAGLAWVAQPQNARKPYAMALVMDVEGKQAQTKKLLAKVAEQLKKKGATEANSQVGGTAVQQYTLPRLPGDTMIRQTFYALTQTQLYATDDLTLLSNLINAYKAGGNANPLNQDATFKFAFGKISKGMEDCDLEYFIRPIGMAKAIRSISGRVPTGQTDVLKVLENQGFAKLSALAGRVDIEREKFDVMHEAFLVKQDPLPEPVQLLDFPNTATSNFPSWIPPQTAGATSFAWNAGEAFWKVAPIVDEVAGQQGTFESVIDGIREDPLGPRIDIKTEVLPFLTNQMFMISEITTPITVESKHALVAIQINDPDNKLDKVLERAMENEPDAVPEDYRGIRLYKVSHNQEEETYDIDDDFGSFSTNENDLPSDDGTPEPLLNNWAIGKFDGYLIFASHPELIREVIDRASTKIDESKLLAAQPDVKAVADALAAMNPDGNQSAWRVMRTDRAFQMQYELFRSGQLTDSKSIAATILDRIVRPRKEMTPPPKQKVKGNMLPPFEQIRGYLTAQGYMARTTPDGWSIKSFVLGK